MAESRVFDKIRIGLASPEEVRRWSYGEVKKPETINYRTFKPERDGLFCERIFGPTKDWECHCGRYKKVKFKGIVCDRCGVEVTRSKVRRERMGHIELAAPVSHIWYLKGVPSPMALLLDMSPRPLEKVIYFGSYIVTHVNKRLILDEWPQIEKAVLDEMEDRRNAPPAPPPALPSVTLPLEAGEDVESLVGRIVTEDVKNPETGEVLLESGDVVTQEDVDVLSDAGLTELNVESDGVASALVEDVQLSLPSGTLLSPDIVGLLRKCRGTADVVASAAVTEVREAQSLQEMLNWQGLLLNQTVAGRAFTASDAVNLGKLELDPDPTLDKKRLSKQFKALVKKHRPDQADSSDSQALALAEARMKDINPAKEQLDARMESGDAWEEVTYEQGRELTANELRAIWAGGQRTLDVEVVTSTTREIRLSELEPDLTLATDIGVVLPKGTEVGDAQAQLLRSLGATNVRLAIPGEPELVPAPRTLDDIAGDDLESGLELLQKVEKKQLLVEDEFRRLDRVVLVLAARLGRQYEGLMRAGLGAAAVRELLEEIDLEALKRELETEVSQTQGPRRLRAVKRLEIVRAFVESKSRPEWMILDTVPVIPPELRPMVQLDGGRFATSDLNDLYRRIINRNNRLKKIQEIRAPESIINHEKRLLQEAVDALIDNGRRTRPVVGSNNRPLRSLSDMLKGKEGRFRKNLLGKRVDYSGRSVIVVGPSLKLHQCGLPKEMALELFKPFVMKALVDRNITTNIKTAKRLIDRVRPEVWDALEDVIKDHPVMLNRAPTLHRLGIQAFEPVLVDGKAIRVHPLVCAAFGADFDGDQMAVHVPLSNMAQAEGQCLMLATNNLFKPSDGAPIVAPQQDIVLGLYYMAQAVKGKEGSGLVFSSIDEAQLACQEGSVHLQAPIRVRDFDPDHVLALRLEANPDATPAELDRLDPYAPGTADAGRVRRKLFDVSPGRLVLASIFPYMMRYTSERNVAKGRKGVIDQELEMSKKQISELIRYCYEDYGAQRTIKLLDDLKELGFTYAMRSALSISITDMDEPEERDVIINETEERVKDINRRYRRGTITAGERESQVLSAWTGASSQVADAILSTIGHENPLFMMTNSGARGSKTQITQLSGMRGLMADPFGGIIEELPIKSNFHRGLNILEYFVSTHGQRKGLADTALRTADAGYLTRRLVDVAQDVIVRKDDCGTVRGIYVSEIKEAGSVVEPLHERIRGRVALDPIVDPKSGEVLAEANEILTDQKALAVEKAGVNRVGLRSPLTCEARQGICVHCYGRDMATQKTVEVGTAVGIIAAQSIGEPGTQLTMRTFHTGGVAGKNIVGVANVKQKKQEALKELHLDIERGHVSLDEGGVQGSERERSRAVQAMLKVLEEQVGGLLRVVELVEGRKPKGQAIITEVDGNVVDIDTKGSRRVIIHSNFRMDSGESPNGKVLGEPVRRPSVLKRDVVDPETGEVLAKDWDGVLDVVSSTTGEVVAAGKPVKKTTSRSKEPVAVGDILLEVGTEINEKAARVLRDNNIEAITVRHSHLVPYRGTLEVEKGQDVRAGDRLTEGPLDPDRVLELQGITGVQDYMVKEIQSVYKSQGVDINDKHIEVIVRQMLKKRKILDPGDTVFLPGQMLDKFEFEDANAMVREHGGTEATAEWLLLGITEASLATESFLSAASFQKTTKVLADAAVRGKKDNLLGLKENVIIGRLIPAGTGIEAYHDMQVGGQEGRNLLKPEVSSRNIEGIEEMVQALREASGEGGEAIITAAPNEEIAGFTEETPDGAPVAPVEETPYE